MELWDIEPSFKPSILTHIHTQVHNAHLTTLQKHLTTIHGHTHELKTVCPLLSELALIIFFFNFFPGALLEQSTASSYHLLTEKTSIPHQHTLTREHEFFLQHIGHFCLYKWHLKKRLKTVRAKLFVHGKMLFFK